MYEEGYKLYTDLYPVVYVAIWPFGAYVITSTIGKLATYKSRKAAQLDREARMEALEAKREYDRLELEKWLKGHDDRMESLREMAATIDGRSTNRTGDDDSSGAGALPVPRRHDEDHELVATQYRRTA